MRRKDIERIIKQGSVRQKIKLYMTSVALSNVDLNNIDYEIEGDELNVKGTKLLSKKEQDLIYNSITAPKDVEYYNNLRTWHKGFLMFKPVITNYNTTFDYLTAQISSYTLQRLTNKHYEDTINDMLEVVEDEKLQEKQVNIALKKLKLFQIKRLQDEEGFLPLIEIPDTYTDNKILPLIKVLNMEIKEAKEFIDGIKVFLNKHLPLVPYKQFVKDAEKRIKANIKKCRDNMEMMLLGRDEDPRFNIIPWEDVEIEVTDEDIEDIKRAGL